MLATISNVPKRYTMYGAMLATAALLIALLAVTFATSPAQATSTAETLALATDGSNEGNPLPQQQGTPRHASPEPCPGETGNDNDKAASVVDSGHYALFDVYWNPDEGELTNNLCPPSITYVPEKTGFGGHPARTDRAASSINIAAEPPTIIHIPNSAMVTLTESDYPKDRDKYEKLWEADDAENPDGDGDRMVWALPACPPDGDPSDVGLCLSYSAALLNPADWVVEDDKGIEFIVTHVHQVDIDKQDRRYVLVYDLPEEGTTGKPKLRWYSADQETDTVYVAPGGYDRPTWFFPSRGAYEFQVYIRGNPNLDTNRSDGLKPVSDDKSISSDLRAYILHVGAEADLGVSVSVEPALDPGDTTLDPGDDVTIEITASSAGPDVVPSAKVDVILPEGLTYSSHTPASDTFTKTDGVWTWDAGRMGPSASKTLAITATVDAGTHGETLTARAEISATETVTTKSGTFDVPVPDPGPAENTAEDTVTVESSANVDPMFQVTRSVPENSPGGTLVGDPISVREPNSGDTLTFGLTGDGADNFTVSSFSGSAQIAVASGANLQTGTSYALVLTVSDGKDDAGNADSSVDDTIGVLINPPSLVISANSLSFKKGQHVILTATPGNLPAGHGALTYRWIETNPRDGLTFTPPHDHGPTWTFTKQGGGKHDITYHYGVEVSWTKDGVETRILSSNQVTVIWSN